MRFKIPVAAALTLTAVAPTSAAAADTAGEAEAAPDRGRFSEEDHQFFTERGFTRTADGYQFVGAEKSVLVGDDGWTSFSFAEKLQRSHTFLMRGDISEGGECHFSSSGEVPGNRPIEERSIAINIGSCEMLIERGLATQEDIRQEEGQSTASAETGDEPAPLAAAVVGEGTCCFQGGSAIGGQVQDYKNGPVRKYAYHKARWEDPPGADVNSVRAEVDWESDGNCANLGATRYRTKYGWLQQTGWTRTFDSHNGNRACGYATTVSGARYLNGVFCTSVDIRSHYDTISVSGRPDGRYNMTWDSYLESNSQNCASLLSFHRTHGYFSTW